jgi:hypothetical protein
MENCIFVDCPADAFVTVINEKKFVEKLHEAIKK